MREKVLVLCVKVISCLRVTLGGSRGVYQSKNKSVLNNCVFLCTQVYCRVLPIGRQRYRPKKGTASQR